MPNLQNLILLATVAACSLSAQDSSIFIYEAKQLYGTVSDNLAKGAEEMPAKDYAFQPTPESPTFADLIAEVVGAQADVCSAIEGTHVDMEGPSSATKADLVSALEKSDRKCAAAYSSVNNFNASQQVHFGAVQRSRLGLLSINTSHDSEVYGQVAVYLRLKGLVPPSNRARLLPVAGRFDRN
jgi:hypothetical protein